MNICGVFLRNHKTSRDVPGRFFRSGFFVPLFTVILLTTLTGSALGQWWEWPKVAPGDNLAGDRFGYAVAVDNELAIIGAPGDDNAEGTEAGAAYIYAFDGSTWTEVTKLVPSTIGPGDRFGCASRALHRNPCPESAVRLVSAAGRSARSERWSAAS